jgi:phage-related protein
MVQAEWDLVLKREKNSNANLKNFMSQVNSETKFGWKF